MRNLLLLRYFFMVVLAAASASQDYVVEASRGGGAVSGKLSFLNSVSARRCAVLPPFSTSGSRFLLKSPRGAAALLES